MITVKEHTRRPPEKPADPFASVMEARRRAYARRWGVELVGTDDERLSRPVADPVRGGPSLSSIADQLSKLAKLMSNIGR